MCRSAGRVGKCHCRAIPKCGIILTVGKSVEWRGKKKGEDWQKANTTLVIKKGRKEDSRSDRPVSLRSGSGKVEEQLILETMYRCVSNTKVIRSSLYGFPKGKSCLTNLISFHNETQEKIPAQHIAVRFYIFVLLPLHFCIF